MVLAMFFLLGTQERVRNSHGIRAISVRATEVLLYIYRKAKSVQICKLIRLYAERIWL